MFRYMSQCLKSFFILLSVSVATGSVAAETDMQRIKRDLVSAWIVEVQGEARTRTLHIRGAERRQDDVWELDAIYGWTDTRQTSVKAELTVKSDGYKLTLTTQANSVIVAEGSGAGILTGTFTANSGAVKPLKIARVTDKALSKFHTDIAAAANRAIVQPGSDVPAACASLVGGWTGNWGTYGGEEWLWVVQVDASCVAKYQFGRTGYWGPFRTAEIQKGVLSTPCAHGGTCSYERHGDELWGNWRGRAGGSNGIALKKVQIETK